MHSDCSSPSLGLKGEFSFLEYVTKLRAKRNESRILTSLFVIQFSEGAFMEWRYSDRVLYSYGYRFNLSDRY